MGARCERTNAARDSPRAAPSFASSATHSEALRFKDVVRCSGSKAFGAPTVVDGFVDGFIDGFSVASIGAIPKSSAIVAASPRSAVLRARAPSSARVAARAIASPISERARAASTSASLLTATNAPRSPCFASSGRTAA